MQVNHSNEYVFEEKLRLARRYDRIVMMPFVVDINVDYPLVPI